MVQLSTLVSTLTVAAVAGSALAHPHVRSSSELEFQRRARRSLGDCSSQLRKRDGVAVRSMARRQAYADSIRKARGLSTGPFKRDLATVLATDHKSNLTGVTNNTDAATLFDTNSSCVLAPEVTQGPYYVDGEYVRYDIREDQEGIPTYLDIELIDVSTCEPVPDIYIDIWSANATGVYSGIVASGNGESTDASNINTTFIRGIQQTNEDGVAQWLTIFPGHYTSRATHIHLIAHQTNASVYDNGTYVENTVSHVGQLFFDQDLISEVEATSPYSTNTQDLTENADDTILSEEADDIDPVVEYVLLGDSLSDGVFAWTSVGIDTTAAYTVTPAADYYETGGVANSNSGSGMGGGGSAPSGSAPSGSATGVAPSGSLSASAPSATPSS